MFNRQQATLFVLFCKHTKSEFNRLPKDLMRTIVNHNDNTLGCLMNAINADNENKVMELLNANPRLVLTADNVELREGEVLKRITPLDLALYNLNIKMAAIVSGYFDKLDADETTIKEAKAFRDNIFRNHRARFSSSNTYDFTNLFNDIRYARFDELTASFYPGRCLDQTCLESLQKIRNRFTKNNSSLTNQIHIGDLIHILQLIVANYCNMNSKNAHLDDRAERFRLAYNHVFKFMVSRLSLPVEIYLKRITSTTSRLIIDKDSDGIMAAKILPEALNELIGIAYELNRSYAKLDPDAAKINLDRDNNRRNGCTIC